MLFGCELQTICSLSNPVSKGYRTPSTSTPGHWAAGLATSPRVALPGWSPMCSTCFRFKLQTLRGGGGRLRDPPWAVSVSVLSAEFLAPRGDPTKVGLLLGQTWASFKGRLHPRGSPQAGRGGEGTFGPLGVGFGVGSAPGAEDAGGQKWSFLKVSLSGLAWDPKTEPLGVCLLCAGTPATHLPSWGW